MARNLVFSLLALPAVFAAQAPTFVPPSAGPLQPSVNLGGPSNGSLSKSPIVHGKHFDRFIQIWLENTDFKTATSSPTFQSLMKQGITMNNYYALTHPSEPNYVAAVGGDFFGMHDDNLYNIPNNVSTIVDLLGGSKISWASYQEGLKTDGDEEFSEDGVNYHDNPDHLQNNTYTYYVRKHDPLIIFDSVASVDERRVLQRNFNDIIADVNASALPQWVFITPNLVNDAHDTTIDFASQWLNFWLVPMLENPNFNDNNTLILLTFDENETQSVNNQILSIILGGALKPEQRGTIDTTYYTHYSSLSTVQVNWGLGCLGRGDTDPVMSNVFQVTAEAIGFTGNNPISDPSQFPLTNISGPVPGPLNPAVYIPFAAPNTARKCHGPGDVFVAQGVDTSISADTLPQPVNLTALNQDVPAAGPRVPTGTAAADSGSPSPTAPAADNGPTSSTPKTSAGVAMIANLALSVFAAGVAIFFSF